MEDDYKYPYGTAQIHEALEDLDRRLKALEPKTEAKPLGFLPLDSETESAMTGE